MCGRAQELGLISHRVDRVGGQRHRLTSVNRSICFSFSSAPSYTFRIIYSTLWGCKSTPQLIRMRCTACSCLVLSCLSKRQLYASLHPLHAAHTVDSGRRQYRVRQRMSDCILASPFTDQCRTMGAFV